jgi:hypothetical protein
VHTGEVMRDEGADLSARQIIDLEPQGRRHRVFQLTPAVG